MADTTQKWYYANNSQRQGPVSFDELLRFVLQRKLGEDDLVWTKGMQDWQRASTVEGLFRPTIVATLKNPLSEFPTQASPREAQNAKARAAVGSLDSKQSTAPERHSRSKIPLYVAAYVAACVIVAVFFTDNKPTPVAGANSNESATSLVNKAEKGDVAAQFALGLSYDGGEGVEKDSVKAVRWYRKAAEQGHAMAEFGLGLHYETGEGVSKDPAMALMWYRKSAEGGYPLAQVALGDAYDQGDGLPQSDTQAIAWYRKAADQGYADAQKKLSAKLSRTAAVAHDQTNPSAVIPSVPAQSAPIHSDSALPEQAAVSRTASTTTVANNAASVSATQQIDQASPAADHCEADAPSPQAPEERVLLANGKKYLTGKSVRLGTTGKLFVVEAALGYDGMCRPSPYQIYVFNEGKLAGTLSSNAMQPRSDGAISNFKQATADSIEIEIEHYKPTDAACCPSSTEKKIVPLAQFIAATSSQSTAATAAITPPSFDCRKASTITENAICASQELSTLDGQLGRAFSDAVASLPVGQLSTFRTQQVAWIRDRDSQCQGDEQCLKSQLQSRIAELANHSTIDPKTSGTTSKSLTEVSSKPTESQPTISASQMDTPNFAANADFAALDLSAIAPAISSSLLKESGTAYEQLDNRVKKFIVTKACSGGIAGCLAGGEEPQKFFVDLMKSAFGTQVDGRGYTYQDIPAASFGQSVRCLASVNNVYTGVTSVIDFYMSEANVKAGDKKYTSAVIKSKEIFEQWIKSLNDSCHEFMNEPNSRPNLAYVSVSKFIAHVNEVTRSASVDESKVLQTYNEKSEADHRLSGQHPKSDSNMAAKHSSDLLGSRMRDLFAFTPDHQHFRISGRANQLSYLLTGSENTSRSDYKDVEQLIAQTFKIDVQYIGGREHFDASEANCRTATQQVVALLQNSIDYWHFTVISSEASWIKSEDDSARALQKGKQSMELACRWFASDKTNPVQKTYEGTRLLLDRVDQDASAYAQFAKNELADFHVREAAALAESKKRADAIRAETDRAREEAVDEMRSGKRKIETCNDATNVYNAKLGTELLMKTFPTPDQKVYRFQAATLVQRTGTMMMLQFGASANFTRPFVVRISNSTINATADVQLFMCAVGRFSEVMKTDQGDIVLLDAIYIGP